MVETIFKPQINVRSQSLNRDWVFSKKPYNALEEVMGKNQGRIVQLPHDYMLEDNVKPEAVSGPATGYYDGSVAYYPVSYTHLDVYKRQIMHQCRIKRRRKTSLE